MEKPKHLIILSGMALAFLLFVCVSLFFTPLFKPAHLNDETLMFFSRLSFWLCTLVIYWYVAKVEKQALLLWAEKEYSFLFYISSVVSVLLILLAGMTVISLTGISLGLNNKSVKLQGMLSVLRKNRSLLIFTCLTAGVTEELIFRGYLIPRLQLLFKKPIFPLILSSVLFGVAHIGYGSVVQVIGPIFIGLVFAIYYQRYRNIKVVIVCHFLWDFLTLIILTH